MGEAGPAVVHESYDPAVTTGGDNRGRQPGVTTGSDNRGRLSTGGGAQPGGAQPAVLNPAVWVMIAPQIWGQSSTGWS